MPTSLRPFARRGNRPPAFLATAPLPVAQQTRSPLPSSGGRSVSASQATTAAVGAYSVGLSGGKNGVCSLMRTPSSAPRAATGIGGGEDRGSAAFAAGVPTGAQARLKRPSHGCSAQRCCWQASCHAWLACKGCGADVHGAAPLGSQPTLAPHAAAAGAAAGALHRLRLFRCCRPAGQQWGAQRRVGQDAGLGRMPAGKPLAC